MKTRKANGHVPPEKRTPEGRFAPGASGNPGGRPKGLREFREDLETSGTLQEAHRVLDRAVRSKDIRIAFDAAKFVVTYAYGRPAAQEAAPDSSPARIWPPNEESVAEAQRILTPKDDG